MKHTDRHIDREVKTAKKSLDTKSASRLDIFIEKVAKNVRDPKKGAAYARSVVRRATKPVSKLTEPLREIEREYLLGHAPAGVHVERMTDKPISQLSYEEIKNTLTDVNNTKIHWAELKKRARDNRMPQKVSIIVLVLNNPEMTMRCIDSVMQTRANTAFELIVVDNGSNARTIKCLRKYKVKYPDMVLVHNDQNLNFSVGNNVGFTYATGDMVVFLNNDTYVTGPWIDSLVRPLKNKKVKAVQPALFYPDNTIQCIGIVFSDKSSLGYGLYVNISKNNKTAVQSRKFQAVTGACLAMRSADFAAMKGFDPLFINGQEDVDLCLRLTREEGTYCYCETKSVVYHDEGKTKGRGKYVMNNRTVFLDRWSGVPKPDDQKHYAKDGYRVVKWKSEPEDIVEKGLGIFTPVIKRIKK